MASGSAFWIVAAGAKSASEPVRHFFVRLGRRSASRLPFYQGPASVERLGGWNWAESVSRGSRRSNADHGQVGRRPPWRAGVELMCWRTPLATHPRAPILAISEEDWHPASGDLLPQRRASGTQLVAPIMPTAVTRRSLIRISAFAAFEPDPSLPDLWRVSRRPCRTTPSCFPDKYYQGDNVRMNDVLPGCSSDSLPAKPIEMRSLQPFS